MTREKFCITSPLYFPHPGGYESYTKRLVEELIKNGNEVILITHALDKSWDLFCRETNNLLIIRLESFMFLNGRFPVYKINKRNKKAFEYLFNSNIKHFMINTRFYFLSLKIAKISNSLNKTPILLDHGSAHLVLGNKLIDPIVKISEHLLTTAIKKYDIKYYGISKASFKWLEHFKIKANDVLPNAIDSKIFKNDKSSFNLRKKFNINKTDFIVYFVGRYTPEKGLNELLETAKIMKEFKDVHFVFSGKGPLLKNIEKLEDAFNIHNTGVLNSSDISAAMQQANVLCMPTRSEGFCTALLEAGACSLPAIITKVGGTDELIINDDYGYILKDTKTETIKKAILFYKNNPNQTKIIRTNFHNIVKTKYNWGVVTKKILKAFQENE